MDSFFFNITDKKYKITKTKNFTRVDISNGILFLTILSKSKFHIKNLDRMLMFIVAKKGNLQIDNHHNNTSYEIKKDHINIYSSSKQNFTFKTDEGSNLFILFVADFFLKRYLSRDPNEPIDFLYNKTQNELSNELINSQPIDALTLYIIDKIINTKSTNSLLCEHNIIEFILHRFSLLDILDKNLTKEELLIASKAKDYLLKSFENPPTIQMLSHLCATNESKLKIVFKKVYKTTIWHYIQKLRLKEANLLLKEQFLTIGEISKRVGYRHQGHFSKLFFKTYGVYPKDLLK